MSMKISNTKGFTLVELLVIIAMLGVVTAIGMPTFQSMRTTSALADTTNELVMALKRARAEAIKRGRDVRVCSSTDSANCSGAAGNWVKGWIVYSDVDNDGQVDEDQGELIWVNQMDSKTSLTITPTNTAHDVFIDFSYTGTLAQGVAGGFDVCSGNTTNSYAKREITISVSGDVVFNKDITDKC